MREYKYKFLHFFVASLGPLLLMSGLLLWAIYGKIIQPNDEVYTLVILIVPILLLSTLGALNQPNKITDDDITITFYGFGRKHAYKWTDIQYLKVKEFIFTDKVYLRVGRQGLLSGRYWFNVNSLSNGNKFMEKMKNFEAKLHPK